VAAATPGQATRAPNGPDAVHSHDSGRTLASDAYSDFPKIQNGSPAPLPSPGSLDWRSPGELTPERTLSSSVDPERGRCKLAGGW